MNPLKRIAPRLILFILCAFGSCAFSHACVARANNIPNNMRNILQQASDQLKVGSISLSLILPTHNGSINLSVGHRSKVSSIKTDPNNLYQIGSITKTFTAALAYDAVRNHKLSLDDKVGKFFPKYKKWSSITIAELLNQTSGMFDYDQSPGWWNQLNPKTHKVWSSRELLKIAYKYPDNFLPGKGWAYSNSNYVLLGMIVAKVNDSTLKNLMSNIAKKYQLNQTYYLLGMYPHSVKREMVQGYYNNAYNMTDQNGSWLQGAGALVSRPENIVRWAYRIMHSDQAKGSTQLPWVSTKTGARNDHIEGMVYHAGIFRMNTPNGLVYFTPGLTPGYTSMIAYAPCLDAYFAYSTNLSPPHGIHKFMIEHVMRALSDSPSYNKLMKHDIHIPKYCKNISFAKKFSFPKIG